MKTKKYILCASVLLLTACASEAPFDGPKDREKGSFAKSALNLKVQTDHVIKQTKAGDEVILDDVNVTFFTPDKQLVDHYIYGHMPEVVVLEEGDYYLSAVYTHFGEEKPFDAAFDAPFYQGDSQEFAIQPNRITSDLDVVKCALQNVMTSVVFDPVLKENMSDDAYVELKINENSEHPLNFTLEHEGGQHYGYFECKGEQTLVATFHGKINGAETSETKTMSNVSAGNHYRITFKLHDYQGENSGSHTSEVVLDASVAKTDVDGNVSIEDMGLGDSKLDENERPNEDPENPVNPDDPQNPDVLSVPEITPNEGIGLGVPNEVAAGSVVELTITSETGITGFTVVINSDKLTPDELDGVGLTDKLDLVNPGQFEEALKGFNFPIKEDVLNQKKVKFSITDFIGLLAALGEGTHNFILTVTDAAGTTTKTLTLITK